MSQVGPKSSNQSFFQEASEALINLHLLQYYIVPPHNEQIQVLYLFSMSLVLPLG